MPNASVTEVASNSATTHAIRCGASTTKAWANLAAWLVIAAESRPARFRASAPFAGLVSMGMDASYRWTASGAGNGAYANYPGCV